jgi:hypothetical protein
LVANANNFEQLKLSKTPNALFNATYHMDGISQQPTIFNSKQCPPNEPGTQQINSRRSESELRWMAGAGAGARATDVGPRDEQTYVRWVVARQN